MKLPFKKAIDSEEETIAAAKEFAEYIKPGDVVCLNGNLGAGKTFFVKQVCLELGINNASSPTFAIVNEYSGKIKVYHFDFYRINKINELFDIGFNDYINDSDSIIFIEWAELFADIIPSGFIEIKLLLNENSAREIEIDRNARK